MKLSRLRCALGGIALLAYIMLGQQTAAQVLPAPNPTQRPKLVVSLVVDQMRWDFLYRYWSSYGTRGFKRVLADGYAYHQMHYDYVPTVTGAGHASIYTGAGPAQHGIAGNNWYDARTGKSVYCTQALSDSIVAVGGDSAAGRMSPQQMLSTTWSDQLRQATIGASKVISIALKDRAAILPGGYSANGAYWFSEATGQWMTSTYYRKELPAWVVAQNRRGLRDSLYAQGWQPALKSYPNSTADEHPGEAGGSVLPKTFSATRNWGELVSGPHGTTLTLELAKAALSGERLGQGTATDVLAISLSSPDYAGHAYGPHSVELEDLYVRLDEQMAGLIDHLDSRYGRGNYLFTLTADHAARALVEYDQSLRIPARRGSARSLMVSCETYLDSLYGKGDWLVQLDGIPVQSNGWLLLNPSAAAQANVSEAALRLSLKAYLQRQAGVVQVVTREEAEGTLRETPFGQGYVNGRSGDVLPVFEGNWYPTASKTGTSHGTHYSYDTHVPMLFFGWRVRAGESYRRVAIRDIAPTICSMLQIDNPTASTGSPLVEVIASALGRR